MSRPSGVRLRRRGETRGAALRLTESVLGCADGLHPQKLDMYVKSNTSITYPTSRTWNNHVKVTGLKPDTTYYYRVSGTNGAGAAYLPTYKFKTARPAGDDKPLTIATFGDLGLMGRDGLSTKTGPIGGDNYTDIGEYDSNTIQSLLQSKDTYDFMYHVGDIGCALAVTLFVDRLLGLLRKPPTRQLRRLLFEGERPRLLRHLGQRDDAYDRRGRERL